MVGGFSIFHSLQHLMICELKCISSTFKFNIHFCATKKENNSDLYSLHGPLANTTAIMIESQINSFLRGCGGGGCTIESK